MRGGPGSAHVEGADWVAGAPAHCRPKMRPLLRKPSQDHGHICLCRDLSSFEALIQGFGNWKSHSGCGNGLGRAAGIGDHSTISRSTAKLLGKWIGICGQLQAGRSLLTSDSATSGPCTFRRGQLEALELTRIILRSTHGLSIRPST
jgi:hypothetical protein